MANSNELLLSAASAWEIAIKHGLGDPFDRILVAQAQLENVPILTADPVFDDYEVERIAAAR